MSNARSIFLGIGLCAIVGYAAACEPEPPPAPPDLSTSPSAEGDDDIVMRRALDRASSARTFLEGTKRDMKMRDGGPPGATAEPPGDDSAPARDDSAPASASSAPPR